MKIKAYLDFMQFTILHRTELDLPTLKYLLNPLSKYLTKAEYNRIKQQLEMILNNTSQQLTLNQSVNKAIAKNLDEKLTKLKNGIDKKCI